MPKPFYVENDKLKVAQVVWIREAENMLGSPSYFPGEEDYYSGGDAVGFGSQFADIDDEIEFSLSPDYTLEDPAIYVRQRYNDRGASDFEDTIKLPGIKWSVSDYSDEAADPNSIGGFDETMHWRKINVTGGTPFNGATCKIQITSADEDNYDGVIYDLVAVVDERFENQLNFDNTVHEAQGYCDGPELYPPNGVSIEAEEELADTNITSARLNASIEDHTKGNQSLGLSFDTGQTYSPTDGSEQNTESISVDANIPGLTVQTQVELSAYPLDGSDGTAQNQTPRYGYNGHEVDSWTVDVDTDNLEVLFNENFNTNRLSVISDLADSSNHSFRWEGDVCRIFKRGSEKTTVDLNKEDITSTTDIEDTYSSVQVIGRNGVQSSIIESDDAPPFIDRHKEIRDRDIESTQDARRKAIKFISDNGDIIFEGEIDTLPTRAPLGEIIDGSLFSHGKDMFIERVNYSKRSSTISLGRRRDLGKEIMSLERNKRSSEILDTT